ncbi:DDE-type integrase/transposase/recombinase, partial [Bacillus toyonensis]|uniref:DDE-type integrase/transposase/recombinase n=1 Tax=Bacillus toyonensis TaxID=155322 RepID=UPI000BFAEAA7
DQQAPYMFMKRLVKAFGDPTVLTTDKDPALLCALKKLKHNGFYVHTKHCTVTHFDNLIEQDHRHIKRRLAKSAGFQNLRQALRTIKGIETIHAIYKQNQSSQLNFGFLTYNELQQLFKTAYLLHTK